MPTAMLRHAGDKAEDDVPLTPLGRSLIAVVGINRYTYHDELANARNDADAILGLFKRCGFEEVAAAPSLFDEQATLDALTSLVREQLPGALQPDDSLVIFYAGHGATIESKVPDPEDASKTEIRHTGYLIPVDARKQKPGDWLRLESFLDDISNLPARHVLVILDACQSGFALSAKFKRRGEGQAPGTIAELASRVSRRVMTSATHTQVAMDGGGSGNSLFTETLVDAVENLRADSDGDGYITTTDLFSYVRQQVGDTAIRVHHVKQTPDYGYMTGDGSGELVLSLRGDTYNRLRAAETLGMADLIYQLGWLSGDTKRFSSAVRHYRAADDLASLGKMPLPAARLGLGKALFATGQADEAAGVLAELVRNEGEAAPADTHFYLGLAHAKRGEYALAAEALRAWQGRNPQSPDAAWVGAYVNWLGQAARPGAGRELALLVGINQYRLARARKLDGCVNDVEKLMKPALVTYGGFKADDVTVLTDAQATRARFVEEFRRLQDATLADAIVVHFSGHAVPAGRPDVFGKNDVENVYLILHDTNDDPGYLTNGVTADELHQLMQDLPAGHKTLILDTHPSQRFIELARRDASYALLLASDTAEEAYELRLHVAGEDVLCGMFTGALYRSLSDADGQTLSYDEWITAAIRIVEQATSNPESFPRRQTPYFSGIKSQRVFGVDDIYLSVLEFSWRHDWPELSLDELTKRYAIFCHAITVPHPHGHAAFGCAFLTKNADAQAIAALQTATAQGGDALPTNLSSLVRAQFHAGQYAEARAALHRYARLATPKDVAVVKELDGLLERLATSRKHALLVGINKYRNQGVPRLKGARNDVAAIRRLLTQHWGFQAEDIVELIDARATRASILAEFERLADAARRDPALFFFAGRGSYDQNGLPTLVPYDGRQADVSDIALEELISLEAKDANNLVAILDTGFWDRIPEATGRTIRPVSHTLEAAARFATYHDWLNHLKTLQLGAVTILQSPEM